MAVTTICSDFGAQKNKVWHCFHCFPIYLPRSDGTRCHDLHFLNVKPTFSLSSCTFIERLFSSSSLSAIRVVSSMQNLKKKWHKWTYLQNRKRLTDLDDCVVTRGKQGGIAGEFGTDTDSTDRDLFVVTNTVEIWEDKDHQGQPGLDFAIWWIWWCRWAPWWGRAMWFPCWSKCAWSSQVFTRSTTATPSWIHKTPGHGATSLTCQGNVLTQWMKSPGRVINPVQQIIH